MRDGTSIAVWAATVLAGCLVMVGGAHAQTTTGPFVAVALHGVSASYGDDAGSQRGAGGGARLGYGLAPRVALYAGGDVSYANGDALEGAYTMSRAEAGVLLHLQPGQALTPYLSGGYSVRRARFDTRAGDVTSTGGAVTVGGGLLYYLRAGLALEAGVAGAFGTFKDVRFEGVTLPNVVDVSATTLYLRGGLTWWLRGR